MDHVIVLAGGEGRRLGEVARARYGYPRPKQFCDFGEGVTLLNKTLARARRLAAVGEIVVVTTAAHRREADECLAHWPGVRRLEQPCNRDTLPGIALPVLDILTRDPHANVVILPSDHAVGDDEGFVRCVANALAELPRCRYELLLLGAQPEDPEDGYGWIVPAPVRSGLARVAAFREKPPAGEVPELIRSGALVNTFVMVGGAWDFAERVLRYAPEWFEELHAALGDPSALARAYDRLPPANFSELALQPAQALRLVPLPMVGWSDVGTPERLERSQRADARSVA